MTPETAPATRGRKIFNIFSALVLVLFALFCLAITAGVASIPKLREAAERIPS